jgi:hypothetical protein
MLVGMKPTAEMHEGPEAFERFKNAMKAIVSVPHDVIQARIEEHKRQAAKNPNKRGPKAKKAK